MFSYICCLLSLLISVTQAFDLDHSSALLVRLMLRRLSRIRWRVNRGPINNRRFTYRYLLSYGEWSGRAILVEYLLLTGVVNDLPFKRGEAGLDSISKRYGCDHGDVSVGGLGRVD